MKITTIAEAKANDEKYYFTGKLCAQGHVDKRKVSDNHCLQCDRDRAQALRDKRKKLADVTSDEHQAIRQKALANREVTYNTGEKCSVGHSSDRYTASTTCVECLAENSKGFRQRRRHDLASETSAYAKNSQRKREHDYEPAALDYIAKQQLSVIKIKRRRRIVFEPVGCIHLGPMNNRIETFE